MPTHRGAEGSSRLAFTRRTLEASHRSRASEHEDVNPHKFYRALRSRLADLRTHEDPAYDVVGEPERDLRFDADAAGRRTGAFTARAQARSQTPAIGDAIVRHRPWGPHGAALVALGLLVLSFGLLANLLIFAGAATVLAGVALFSRQAEGQIPLRRRDVLSVHLEGEAREQVRRSSTGHRCELTADIGILYAGDVFLTIPEDAIPELGWSLRTELANRRARWEQALEDGGPIEHHEDPQTGFFGALGALIYLDGHRTKRRVEQLQRAVRRDLAVRQAHTQLMADLRAVDVRERELGLLEREIATVENEMHAFVERERFPPVVDPVQDAPVASVNGDGRAKPRAPRPRREPAPRPRPRIRTPAPEATGSGTDGRDT